MTAHYSSVYEVRHLICQDQGSVIDWGKKAFFFFFFFGNGNVDKIDNVKSTFDSCCCCTLSTITTTTGDQRNA